MAAWDDADWTQSRYFNFLRGVLRSGMLKYPVKHMYLKERCREAPKGSRFAWVVDCECCGKTVGKSHAEVDHIECAGSLSHYKDLPKFAERLFCGKDNFQILCKQCHSIKTYADRFDMTFEEAAIEKRVIEFGKLSTTQQKSILVGKGVAEGDISNAKKRRDAYREYLKGVKSEKLT